MTSVSLQQLDNGDAFATNTDSAEQITKLFPKCRPRADVNLNPVVLVRSAVGNGGSSEREEPVTTDTFDISTTVTTAVATPTSPNAIAGIGVGASVGGAQDRCVLERRDDDDVEEDGDILPPTSASDDAADEDVASDAAVAPLCNIAATYKLRDSRIIEIAGGREIYSQSRTKASRKQRHEMKKGVWDVRARRGGSVTNVSSAVSAREVTETVFSTEVCSVRHRRATRGDSVEGVVTVVPPPTNNSGEVVVFDDIGENWRGEHGGGGDGNDDLDRTDVSQSECLQLQQQHENDEDEIEEGSSRDVSPPPPPCHRAPATDFFKVVASASDIDGDSPSPEPNGDEVAQVIGGLPIAVYEGSPRRYGPRESDTGRPSLPSAHSLLASPSVYPPRPGFPQRVVSTPGADGETQRCELSSNGGSPPAGSTFDYLYEFSETRKVLEEFFRRRPDDDTDCPEGSEFQDLDYELHRQASNADPGSSYVGQRLAKVRADDSGDPIRIESPRRLRTMRDSSRRAATSTDGVVCIRDHDTLEQENNFLDLSVGTGSSGDLGETEVGLQVGHSRNFTLSPETTDCDSNCGDLDSEMSLMLIDNELGPSSTGPLGSSGDLAAPTDSLRPYSSMPVLEDGLSSGHASDTDNNNPTVILMKRQITEIEREIVQRSHGNENIAAAPVIRASIADGEHEGVDSVRKSENNSPLDIPPSVETVVRDDTPTADSFESSPPDMNTIDTLTTEMTPPPPAPAPHRRPSETGIEPPSPGRVEAAIQDIRLALQRAKTLPLTSAPESPDEPTSSSPVWVPRQRGHGVTRGGDSDSGDGGRKVPSGGEDGGDEDEADTDLETDRLLGQQRTDDQGFYDDKLDKENKKKGRNKEGHIHDPSVLIEGVLFRARYLGSTQLVCEGQPTKSTRMMQAEEAVSRIKAPDGESQPSTEVDLFISTEKIMVLNTDLKEIMMDHALRTISYIADIGDLVVLMARRRLVPHEMDDPPKINRTPKMICHVFESEEAQFIAQSIGQAFQVAYMEFLKANGIEDHSFVKEMDYQEVLNSQEIFGDELQMFAKKEMQKEVVVPKAKGEILGVVIVESGWGSMLPTVVIANLAPAGAAARCGQLNIGDQIIAINGVSLVGLPLSTCQNYIKNSKNQTVVKLTVVPCAPVVEVKIKRPDTKYQLGFSVQNGVICSLLRGGIAERGGVRVGHRIIEINNQSVVAVPHEKIVNLLATSVGEILMKTMPTSMFRLLTGQENPVYI